MQSGIIFRIIAQFSLSVYHLCDSCEIGGANRGIPVMPRPGAAQSGHPRRGDRARRSPHSLDAEAMPDPEKQLSPAGEPDGAKGVATGRVELPTFRFSVERSTS